MPSANTISEAGKIEAMKGYPNYYKVRFGSYRIGIKIEKDRVVFERVLHRKEIYRFFPWPRSLWSIHFWKNSAAIVWKRSNPTSANNQLLSLDLYRGIGSRETPGNTSSLLLPASPSIVTKTWPMSFFRISPPLTLCEINGDCRNRKMVTIDDN